MNNASEISESSFETTTPTAEQLDKVPDALARVTAEHSGGGFIDIGNALGQQAAESLRFPDTDYTVVNVEDILSNQAPTDQELGPRQVVVLPGYSQQSEEDKAKIQGYVRAQFQNNNRKPGFVLDTQLPEGNPYDPNLPWNNGPFERKSAWSIGLIGDDNLHLIEHKLREEYSDDESDPHYYEPLYHWDEKKSIEL
jgi:hypothetical protein